MPSWDAISNFMVERQENRDMGQFDHVRMGAEGYVYPEQQPLELSEDQPDQFGSPQAFITAGGGLDEQLDTRPSLTQGPEDTWRDTGRMDTLNFLQEKFGWDTQTARDFAETLWGTSGELSKTALGIGVADLLPITAAPLTMQEGAQLFSEGMETGSGMDMAVGGVITAFGALEALPVFGAGFKMMNKAAQSEILREFIGTAADGFTRTGEVTQDILIEAGEAAQARLDSMMSGTTLSANPVGAAGDAIIAGAGRMAGARRSAETDKMVADDLVNRPELWGEGAPDINERREMVDAMLRGERFEGEEGVARLFNDHAERLSIEQAEPAPVFYSAVANAVDALPMEKGNASQMRAMIAKSAEVKPEEMAWIGLDDFLKGKKSVTKQEIKEFVDANQVRIEEVVKAGDYPQRTGDEWQALIMQAERRQDFDEAERLTAEWEAAEGFGGRGSPKFSDYTLPGGENYREVLLRLPEQPVSGARYAIKNPDGPNAPATRSSYSNATTREEAIAEAGGDASRVIEIRGNETVNPNFTGGHYDEPNVLAHMRLNDRTGPDGEKILFVEEIQSDWHQKGRKQGYKTPEITKKSEDIKRQQDDLIQKRTQLSSELFRDFNLGGTVPPDGNGVNYYSRDIIENNDYKNIGRVYENGAFHIDEGFSQANPEAAAKLKELAEISYETGYLEELRPKGSFVPDAPLKKTWHEMSFRRIARMAAEEGYDAIAFTPGKLQAERYDLSKHIERVELRSTSGGVGKASEDVSNATRLIAYDKNGSTVLQQTIQDPEDIANYIGKDAADKLVNANGFHRDISGMGSFVRTIATEDLQVGGEGMKGFYDKMLKGYASKWGKKFGAKVGVTDINTGRRVDANLEVVDTPSGNFVVIDRVNGGQLADFGNRQDAEAYVVGRKVEATGKTMEQVWTLPVTKKMRDSVLGKGVATFGAAGVAAGLNNEARPNGN